MLRHDDEEAGAYTLYLEHLGGLVPLLKGRRTSKIRPEFVIFDPQAEGLYSFILISHRSHYMSLTPEIDFLRIYNILSLLVGCYEILLNICERL